MTIKIINGDCGEVDLPPNYFDTLITDPPYGLKFMGKDWDRGIPGVAFWKKFLVACKPGAIALVFGGTRTFHRLTCVIEDAGWEIRDCMMWLYGSGFPKSHDISKAIDKAKGAERKVVGIRHTRTANEKYGNGKGTNLQTLETMPNSDLAKQWEGYGTALKPAWEPIIVAMKPLDGTFAQNAEKWGVGGLWIDGGRIGTGEDKMSGGCHGKIFGTGKKAELNSTQGRWPANLLFDEEAAAMLDEQSGFSKSNPTRKNKGGVLNTGSSYGQGVRKSDWNEPGDSGGASRFFYCAKASRSERNAGLEGMKKKQMYKCDNSPNSLEIFGTTDGGQKPRANNHPTVKPLKLMEYLCRLTKTPAGGIVLDPFGGSGTTALACQNTDRDCTIVEKDPAYCKIIKARTNSLVIEKSTIIVEKKETPLPVIDNRQRIIDEANRKIQEKKCQ